MAHASQVGEVLDAHNGRISSLIVHGNTLYSAGFDGWVRGWNADTLAPTAAVPAAHGGEKVHAMALGSDGLLYTGGDDKVRQALARTCTITHTRMGKGQRRSMFMPTVVYEADKCI